MGIIIQYFLPSFTFLDPKHSFRYCLSQRKLEKYQLDQESCTYKWNLVEQNRKHMVCVCRNGDKCNHERKQFQPPKDWQSLFCYNCDNNNSTLDISMGTEHMQCPPDYESKKFGSIIPLECGPSRELIYTKKPTKLSKYFS